MKQILKKIEDGSQGREVHKFLLSTVYRKYYNEGKIIDIEYHLQNGKVADLYIKKDKIIIECLVRPTLKLVTHKIKIYKKVCSKLIIAYPSDKILNFPIDSFVEVMKIDIPLSMVRKRLNIPISRENMQKAKLKAIMLRIPLNDYINQIIEKETKDIVLEK